MSHKSKLNQINALVSQIRTKVTPLHPVENAEGRWGFATPDGKVAIPHQWCIAGHFYEGLAKVVDDSGKCGFIDKSGTLVIPCQFGCSSHFSAGLCWVRNEDRRIGFIDRKGNLKLPYKWKAVTPFFGNTAAVMDDDGYWYVIDNDGRRFSTIEWKELVPLRNDYYLGKGKHDNWELLNEFGGPLELLDTSKENTFRLPWKDKTGLWGFADTTISFNNHTKDNDRKDIAAFTTSDDGGYTIRCGIVTIKSTPVLAGQWKETRCFREGLARVMDKNRMCGYVDESGKLVIPCRWLNAGPFWGGTAEVEDVDGTLATIDRTGRIIGIEKK